MEKSGKGRSWGAKGLKINLNFLKFRRKPPNFDVLKGTT